MTNSSGLTIPADLQSFAEESAGGKMVAPEDRFVAWARLGAAIEQAGLTWQQCAELLESGVPENVLIAVATNRSREGLQGSPVVEAWHQKLEAEVRDGIRPAASLLAFERESVRKSTFNFASESSPPSDSDETW